MPYTAKQRRYFHAQAAKGKPGMAALAKEADQMAKAGKEKPPVAAKKGAAKKAAAKKTASAMPMKMSAKMPMPKKAMGQRMKKAGGK